MISMDDLKEAGYPPEVTPEPFGPALTARDIDMSSGSYNPYLPMSSPCDRCGGFNMRVGDYICWGMCSRCVDSAYPALKEYWNEQLS